MCIFPINGTQTELLSNQGKFTETNNDDIEYLDDNNTELNSQELDSWSEINNADIIFGFISLTLLIIVNILLRKSKTNN